MRDPASPNLTRFLPALPIAGGIAAAVAAAATIAVLSQDALERLAWTSGVASLIPAAQPPLGTTARLAIAAGSALAAGAVCWAVLFLLFGPGGLFHRDRTGREIRRADAHPHASSRQPMTVAGLDIPLMDVPLPPVVQPLPADLDQTLAAYDPAAMLKTPREPARMPASLAPGERLETFALATPSPSVPPTRRDLATPASIQSLLRRLEEGAARRPRTAGVA